MPPQVVVYLTALPKDIFGGSECLLPGGLLNWRIPQVRKSENMVGMKEICALLLAGGMGAGSVVAVQQAKPAISKPKAKKVHKSAERSIKRTQVSDCPASAVGPAIGIADLGPIIGQQAAQPESLLAPSQLAGIDSYADDLRLPSIIGGGGGGGGISTGINPSPPVPGVPQPESWVLMVAGFGFIGLAMRLPGSRVRKARRQPAA